MSIEYAHEKLMDAVHSMATGAGRIRDRLQDAALVLIRLRPEDFPEGEMRRSFIGIKDDLTFQPPVADEGSIAATLNLTSEDDMREIARRVVALYHAVRSEIRDRS